MARLVTLQVFLEPTDALVVRSLLEAQGFCVFWADDICRLDWLRALAYGGVRVQVLDTEFDSIESFLAEEGWLEGPTQDLRMQHVWSFRRFWHGLTLIILCFLFG